MLNNYFRLLGAYAKRYVVAFTIYLSVMLLIIGIKAIDFCFSLYLGSEEFYFRSVDIVQFLLLVGFTLMFWELIRFSTKNFACCQRKSKEDKEIHKELDSIFGEIETLLKKEGNKGPKMRGRFINPNNPDDIKDLPEEIQKLIKSIDSALKN